MTSRSTPLNTEVRRPFMLRPVAKDYLWGGRRLRDEYGKDVPVTPLAETWECSTHPDGVSTVASGPFAGQALSEVLAAHPEYLGTHPKTKGELPILVKLIDAREDLSIQVHPDDAYAREHEHGQRGKTEMWYVLDAAKDAYLYYGLQHDVDRCALRDSIEDGTVTKYLRRVRIRQDDLFYIEAGTIHGLGPGALVAEVQESSNLTYRLYDYDRVDKNGNRRPLHIDKGLEVADLKERVAPAQPMRVLRYRQGCAAELLCRCRYFEVHRLLINTERCRQLIGYRADSASFRVLLCTSGCGTIFFADEVLRFYKGDCLFVPADSVAMRLHGKAQFLDVRG